MGGFFGIVSKRDIVLDVFYGTDYHSHLGTQRGGMATLNDNGNFNHTIHDIRNTQFRSKFQDDLLHMHGKSAIGCISDYEEQPLIINSCHGRYAIATVGLVRNTEELSQEACKKGTHFSELSGNEINPTELIAHLINQGKDIVDGINNVHKVIKGSASILLLTEEGIYAARDKLGRTPITVGKDEDGFAVTLESCAFPNLHYSVVKELGPGEIVKITSDGCTQLQPPSKCMKICSFLWVYYGYPASTYEGRNAEDVRNICGQKLAENDSVEVDSLCGVPDSGTGHALGYAHASGLPYKRAFVKYTPTWPRSFTPANKQERSRVAKMKLIPIRELIEDKRLLLCEDSIVRGTQLLDSIQCLYDEYGAKEVHMRVACPPLIYACKYLNFSRTRSIDELATRMAIKKLENGKYIHLEEYTDNTSERYKAMVDEIRERLNLTSLKFQTLDHLIEAIGLPKEKLCTYCWSGKE